MVKMKNTWYRFRNSFAGGDFPKDNRGMGTVEVILIIVVLVGLVIIFRDEIGKIVESLFSKITKQTSGF